MIDISRNMDYLAELLLCGDPVYLWCYDADGNLQSSNCPEEGMLHAAFELLGCKARMLEYGAEHETPVTLGTALGVQWGACYERVDGAVRRCWVIGPVFSHDVSAKGIERGLRYYHEKGLSALWAMQFGLAMQQLPVQQNIIFGRYLLMLHYSATGERLSFSDLNAETLRPAGYQEAPEEGRDRHKVWRAEQALLEMVRTGDLNYSQALSASMAISSGVPVESEDALRQGKTSIIVFITLVTRAAIEGGLSPEEAYSLGDSYIQSTESARTISELDVLPRMMYDDFIHRVHQRRSDPVWSPQTQQCVDYIDTHLGQKIIAADLARQVGYTEYYLTRKFKEETGMSVSQYVRKAKVDHAKVLLGNTDITVQEIAEQLGFGTRNYFSHVFQEVTGQTPMEYRENAEKIGNIDNMENVVKPS